MPLTDAGPLFYFSSACNHTQLVFDVDNTFSTPPRRTPLHMAASKLERMECVIVLLEYGAQITATDVLGLRPIDLYPVSSEWFDDNLQ